MSGISKFKRVYSEGVAAEHPDIAGQPEFANRADAEITRRRKERAKKGGPQLPGFVASVKKEEVEVSEAKVDNSLSRSEKETARNKRAGITNNPYIGNKDGQNQFRTELHIDNWGEKKQRGEKESKWTKTKFIRDKTGKVTKYQDSHVSNQNDRRARIENEEFELDEKIDVGADAGATISDFVHSKSKTFKGDSKKQRIKRALGAYYAAQKEETENIYNYVIETLIDSEFAEDYETAENMFEHMSSEFVAVILEEYIEEAKRSRTERRAANAGKKGYNKEGKPVPTGKPRVYDFDKVIADTAGTNVHIKNAEGKRVQSLNDTQYYTHQKNKKLKKGHSYDFRDFDSPEVLAKNAKPIKSTIASMKRDQKRNKPVMTLTARSHKVKSGVTDFLNKHGVNASKVKQHFTGDMPSHLNTGERKAINLKHIVKNNPAGVKFKDDHRGNLEAAREVPKVQTFLVKPNKRGEVVSRSYQATKGGRTSDNPSSTIKQTQRRRQRARRGMGEEMSSYEYWKQFVD
jgi:hypothetical protein